MQTPPRVAPPPPHLGADRPARVGAHDGAGRRNAARCALNGARRHSHLPCFESTLNKRRLVMRFLRLALKRLRGKATSQPRNTFDDVQSVLPRIGQLLQGPVAL